MTQAERRVADLATMDARVGQAGGGGAPATPALGEATAPAAALSREDVARITSSMLPPPEPRWRRIVRRVGHLWLLVAFVVTWQLVSVYGQRINPQLDVMMPPPTAVVSAAADLMQRGVLIVHIVDSLKRVLLAVGTAALLGVPLGLAMGWSARFRAAVDPLLEFIRPIPPLAWIPLSILWFGIGDVQNEFIIFLGCFFPILVNTVAAVKGVEPNLVRAARCLGAGEGQILWRVVLRAALPQIITGIRVGLGVGWMALVAAELVGANSGLGFLISDSRMVLRTDYVIVGMATIGVVGLAIDRVIREVTRRLLPWSQALNR